MDHLEKIHFQTIKWILLYLSIISHVGLVYNKSSDVSRTSVGGVDFDYIEDMDIKRSLTRHAFTLCGIVISWKATLQSTIVFQQLK